MVMPKMLETLSMDDLPNEGLRYIAAACGMEIAKSLIVHCPGLEFRIPMRPNRIAAKRHIEINWDGANAKALARETGMSQRFVYDVLREKSAIRSAPN